MRLAACNCAKPPCVSSNFAYNMAKIPHSHSVRYRCSCRPQSLRKATPTTHPCRCPRSAPTQHCKRCHVLSRRSVRAEATQRTHAFRCRCPRCTYEESLGPEAEAAVQAVYDNVNGEWGPRVGELAAALDDLMGGAGSGGGRGAPPPPAVLAGILQELRGLDATVGAAVAEAEERAGACARSPEAGDEGEQASASVRRRQQLWLRASMYDALELRVVIADVIWDALGAPVAAAAAAAGRAAGSSGAAIGAAAVELHQRRVDAQEACLEVGPGDALCFHVNTHAGCVGDRGRVSAVSDRLQQEMQLSNIRHPEPTACCWHAHAGGGRRGPRHQPAPAAGGAERAAGQAGSRTGPGGESATARRPSRRSECSGHPQGERQRAQGTGEASGSSRRPAAPVHSSNSPHSRQGTHDRPLHGCYGIRSVVWPTASGRAYLVACVDERRTDALLLGETRTQASSRPCVASSHAVGYGIVRDVRPGQYHVTF